MAVAGLRPCHMSSNVRQDTAVNLTSLSPGGSSSQYAADENRHAAPSNTNPFQRGVLMYYR